MKPVVDDTVYGMEVEEARADRVAIEVAFGGLWLWMLRDEAEPLVAAAGKGGLLGGSGEWGGFVLWLVGYSTVVIGMVRVAGRVFWVGSLPLLFLCCRDIDPDSSTDEVTLLL